MKRTERLIQDFTTDGLPTEEQMIVVYGCETDDKKKFFHATGDKLIEAIKKHCKIIQNHDDSLHIEIYDADEYKSYFLTDMSDYEAMLEELPGPIDSFYF